jgi:hypothetical protein
MDQSGWLIEFFESSPAQPLYFRLVFLVKPPESEGLPGAAADWTLDSNKALRFSRKIDAEGFRLAYLFNEPHRIAEHTWVATTKEQR